MAHEHASLKTKLCVILPIAAIYLLLNYIPFESFFSDEIYYLIFRLCTYGVLALVTILLVKRLHVHCYCPLKELNKLWLLPLLLPCLTNFSFVFILGLEQKNQFEPIILSMELVEDFFGSVIEDCIFIEAVPSLFIDYYPKKGKYDEIKFALFTSVIFTVLHSYSFIHNDWTVALYEEGIVFLLTLECSYLAIYYDSAWVPLIAHFLYNAINFVTFDHLFDLGDIVTNTSFLIFTLLTMAFAICYCLALRKISVLQPRRDESVQSE